MIVSITLRAAREETLFPQGRDYLKLLQILVDAKKRHALALYAFCLMPDYCAFIAAFSKGVNTREFIRHINCGYADHVFIVYAKQHLLRNELPLALRDSCELLNAIKNVEEQPVRAGIVRFATQYPYGSAYHRNCHDRIRILENAV